MAHEQGQRSGSYPSLRKAERKRARLTSLLIVFPALGIVAGIYITTSLVGGAIGLAAGCSVAFYGIRWVRQAVPLACPLCSGSLRENYANTARASDRGIEHTCEACSCRFVDYALVQEDAQH